MSARWEAIRAHEPPAGRGDELATFRHQVSRLSSSVVATALAAVWPGDGLSAPAVSGSLPCAGAVRMDAKRWSCRGGPRAAMTATIGDDRHGC